MTPIDVCLVGMGTLGRTVARNILDLPDRFRLVAAVEAHDQETWGRDVGEIVGAGSCGIEVDPVLSPDIRPRAAIVATYSRLDEVESIILELLGRGVDVITSAEELGYPWHEFPEQSRVLDEAAKRNGVSLLGVGANPGFVMDALPAVMSLAFRGVRSITISRALDLTHQRQHKLAKLGVGIEPFEPGSDPGIIGHLGYRQSIEMLADALEWNLDAIEVDPVAPEVVTGRSRRGAHWTLLPGTVAVVRHFARGVIDGRPVIDLRGYFGFLDPSDPYETGDIFDIVGDQQSAHITYEPGMISSATTPAILLNLLAPTVQAEPGLRTSLDYRIGTFSSRGV